MLLRLLNQICLMSSMSLVMTRLLISQRGVICFLMMTKLALVSFLKDLERMLRQLLILLTLMILHLWVEKLLRSLVFL